VFVKTPPTKHPSLQLRRSRRLGVATARVQPALAVAWLHAGARRDLASESHKIPVIGPARSCAKRHCCAPTNGGLRPVDVCVTAI
jgi:hypothetical protein